MNFSVVSKRTGLTYNVYAVKGNEFLIFFNNEFSWQNMNKFRPKEKTEQEEYNESVQEARRLFRSQQKSKEQVMYP